MSVEIDSAYIASVACIENDGNAPEVTTFKGSLGQSVAVTLNHPVSSGQPVPTATFDPTKTYTITVTPNS